MWWKPLIVATTLATGLIVAGVLRSRDKQKRVPIADVPPPVTRPVNPPLPESGTPPPIILPIQGLKRSDIFDTFDQARGSTRKHEATDILAPRTTPALAVRAGTIARLFVSVPGGNTIYLFDAGYPYCYYYAHLEKYADGLKEGMAVRQGEVIGYVGTSGNAPPDTPHLHFAIFLLGPDRKWWQGTPINPYPFLLEALNQGREPAH
jgi:peptidoglycan LD-endopeptidase LytH